MTFDLNTVSKQMAGIVEHTVREFATLHVGAARADFLDSIKVEAYGQFMDMRQVATVSVLDNFSLSVVQFDKSNSKAITKAIQEANLGVGIIHEATHIRITMPKITEDRRKEFVKILGKFAENGKIAIRNARKDAMNKVKTMKQDSEISEDEQKRLEKEIQKFTDNSVEEIDKQAKKKEEEILKV
jgi:ribosome recycling factor